MPYLLQMLNDLFMVLIGIASFYCDYLVYCKIKSKLPPRWLAPRLVRPFILWFLNTDEEKLKSISIKVWNIR